MICDYSITQYLEDLLLATDSEYTNKDTTEEDSTEEDSTEEDFTFEIPEFVKEQVVL